MVEHVGDVAEAKSQKVQNPRVTFLVEAGERYEELRGVEIVGLARLIEDSDAVLEVRGVSGPAVRRWWKGSFDPLPAESI